MFEIIKIDIKTNKNNTDDIFVEFSPKEDICEDLTVRLEERIFKSCGCDVNISNVHKDCKYWVSFNTNCVHAINNGESKQLTSKFNNGFVIKFLNKEFLLYEYVFEYIKTDLDNIENINKPKIWVIGDSHVAHMFKNLEEKYTTCDYFIFNHHSVVGLSLNRFLNSVFNETLKTLKIKNTDVVCFLLGEIDLRKTIIASSNKKKISIDYLLYSLIYRYYEFYKLFSSKFKNTFILSPNGIIKDEYLTYYFEDIFEGNSQEQRFTLWNNFHETLGILLGNSYIDFTCDIRDEKNYISKDSLIENNHHLKSNKNLIKKIYKGVRENYIS
jgi:hypothetical protein